MRSLRVDDPEVPYRVQDGGQLADDPTAKWPSRTGARTDTGPVSPAAAASVFADLAPSGRGGNGQVATDATAKWPRALRPSGQRAAGTAGDVDATAEEHSVGGRHWDEWVAEMLGTALLFGIGFSVVAVLVSPLSPVADDVKGIRFLLVGLNFGALSGLIAVSPLGRRSGAHLNPAVTLAFWLRGHMHRHDLAGYLTAQFVGALIGTAAFGIALGSWAGSIDHARTSPAPVGTATGFAIEAALTFALMATVFVSLGIPRSVRWTPVLVGIALTGLIWVGSPPTGASLNPARSLAPALIEHDFADLWVYFAGPAFGAAAAALAAMACRRRALTAKLFHDPRYRSTMGCSSALARHTLDIE